MNFFGDKETKKIMYLFIGVLVLSALILVAHYYLYNNKLIAEEDLNILDVAYTNVTNTGSNNTITQTSTSNDKTVKNSVINNKSENITAEDSSKKVENKASGKNKETDVKQKSAEEVNNTSSVDESKFEGNEIDVNENAPLEFLPPVEGEIVKDFAEDTLVYSKTLDEWTTHLGIDIKADKTTVVKASADGIVESIKNDPRYGITVILSHKDGFKTVYANLLSTEFVKVGENVEKGQTIGTIGQSASFEVLDDPHLHFEVYKDGQNVNPTMYLK